MPRVNGDKNEFYDLRVNDSLKLFCNVSNSADTSFSWFHFLTPIKNDTGVIVSGNGQALVCSCIWHKLLRCVTLTTHSFPHQNNELLESGGN